MDERNKLIDELSEFIFNIYLEGIEEILYSYNMSHEGYYFISEKEYKLFLELTEKQFDDLIKERKNRITEDAIFLFNKMVKG